VGRVARLVLGYALLVAGALVACWGAFIISLGGDTPGVEHPYAGAGILILVVGVGITVGGIVTVMWRSRPH